MTATQICDIDLMERIKKLEYENELLKAECDRLRLKLRGAKPQILIPESERDQSENADIADLVTVYGVTGTADRLGVTRRTIQRRLKKLRSC